MNTASHNAKLVKSPRGFAIVLVLVFVVLLTVVVLAFFSNATLQRTVADSSANQTKVDLFAQGAVDTLIGDLKQEIVDGSTNGGTPVFTNSGGVVSKIYFPTSSQYIVPFGVGTNAVLPNLVKISSKAPFYTFGAISGTNRASSISTTNASYNGRSISPARWNKPLLLPKNATNSTSDFTPVGAFTPPHWVLVARDGSNPTTVSTNVIGRYAYAIYDEGGLLDLNVAGYPSALNATNSAYKNALAYADLTQIPGLTASAVDAIVNWRNQATLSAGITNYAKYAASNPRGFLATANTNLMSGQSDRMFTSRQQMMDFFDKYLGAASNAPLQNAVQYLGTFSRDVNQPSISPVKRSASSNPMPLVLTSSNGGNVVGDLHPSAADQDEINPSFLSFPVTGSFTRADGTVAIEGEPLVKNRFALNRLAWLTYRGPSASRNQGDDDIQLLVNTYGVPWTFLQKGNATAIQSCFGLQWNSGSGKWTYVHGLNGTNGAIRKLSEVTGREPNFFELLKAAVNVGSLGKGSVDPSNALVVAFDPTEPLKYQFNRDYSADYQIIQLGANILAQSRVDGFPPVISFDNGSAGPRDFRGVVNLPYLYRIRYGSILARTPLPMGPTGTAPNTLTGVGLHYSASGTGTTAGATPYTFASASPLTDPGAGIVVAVPDLWNPHDQNCPLPPASLRPTQFRVVADSANPDTTDTGTGAYNVFTVDAFVNANTYSAGQRNSQTALAGALPAPADPSAPPVPPAPYLTTLRGGGTTIPYANPQTITPANSQINFALPGASSGALFREPTALVTANQPAGSGVSMTTTDPILLDLRDASGSAVFTPGMGMKNGAANALGSLTEPADSSYVGLYLGVFPLRWVITRPALYSPSGANESYWIVNAQKSRLNGSPNTGITCRLQYQDSSGNWVTYDSKYVNAGTAPMTNVAGSNLNNPSGGLINGMWGAFAFVDPRTSRFGSAPERNILGGSGSTYSRIPAAASNWLDASGRVLMTERPDFNSGFGVNHRGTAGGDWGTFTDQGWHYRNRDANPGGVNQIFFQTGLFSENSPYATTTTAKFAGDGSPITTANDGVFHADPDGVVRRAAGAYFRDFSSAIAPYHGLPMATATAGFSGGAGTQADSGVVGKQHYSRPVFLNRPFRNVAELGCVFSDSPWKNIDFFTPESGSAALMDVFCINETESGSGLVAGKVNLNTRQKPVLKAILAGALRDELNTISSPVPALTATEADAIADALIKRTSSGPATGPNANFVSPLANLSELAGKWAGAQTITGSFTPALTASRNKDGSRSYDGFSLDLGGLYGSSGALSDPMTHNIQRFREAPVRALASLGVTRVWNLFIDMVAQTGRYPQTASNAAQFLVEGEQRLWVHLAIDRYTGKVVDIQMEVVKE